MYAMTDSDYSSGKTTEEPRQVSEDQRNAVRARPVGVCGERRNEQARETQLENMEEETNGNNLVSTQFVGASSMLHKGPKIDESARSADTT